MRKYSLTLAALLISVLSFGQNILITDADYDQANPLDCGNFNDGSVQNFFDSGDAGSDYSANENETLTICPDPSTGSKVTVAFGINAGFSWNVHPSDTLYVYDGPNTSAPLLGAHNIATDPNGFTHTASFANNPSGCLTFVFVSNSADEALGWAANIRCGNPPQPFEMHMEAYINGDSLSGSDMSPADTGYVDVCPGDSVLYKATPIFPYSLESTGTGYSQNLSNVTYEWSFSDGTTATGQYVWFTPPAQQGYIVTLTITDQFPNEYAILSKLRVSTTPSFAEAMAVDDTICVGATTELIGGISPTDTAGVDPTTSSIVIGGTFAGLTYLPDGSGQNYTTDVSISGYPAGLTIQNASDIKSLCLTIEHSYLGDLEMGLTCPNGTTINIFNSYNGGGGGELFPGGFTGGGTFLGNAFDNNIGNPGVGEEYCFSDAFATWGTMATEFAGGNTVPVTNPSAGNAMNWNGTYLPEETFANLIGCPINGTWTVTVRDNLSIDDGYIFEWGICFDPTLNPNNETYAPEIVSETWLFDPTIITGDGDTTIVVAPDTAGPFHYVFQITDNFGCTYDTTITVVGISGASVEPTAQACDNEYQVVNTTASLGGTWTQTSGLGVALFSPDNMSNNPLITVSSHGPYEFIFTDSLCGIDHPVSIVFHPDPVASIDGDSICEGDQIDWDVSFTQGSANYLWSVDGTAIIGATGPQYTAIATGVYQVIVSNFCGQASDTADVYVDECLVTIPNVFTPDGDIFNEYLVFDGLEKYRDGHLQIFNRWGNLIYENSDYQNDWDGTVNGKDVSDGTYFFILTYDRFGEIISEKGHVNIFRKQ